MGEVLSTGRLTLSVTGWKKSACCSFGEASMTAFHPVHSPCTNSRSFIGRSRRIPSKSSVVAKTCDAGVGGSIVDGMEPAMDEGIRIECSRK